MKLLITVNPADGLPVYRQIVGQVKDAIAAGKLKPGDKLPTHRSLSAELVIAPMTVKNAYDRLEREGLIVMSAGRGTFVAEGAAQLSASDKRERIRNKARQLLVEAFILDLTLEDIHRTLLEEHTHMHKAKRGNK